VNEERRIEIEEVSEAPSPPKARVSDAADPAGAPPGVADTYARKRDYLEGFLAKQPAPAEAPPEMSGGELYEAVIDALKEIYDPEFRSTSTISASSTMSRSPPSAMPWSR
jgi:hypothetical protein